MFCALFGFLAVSFCAFYSITALILKMFRRPPLLSLPVALLFSVGLCMIIVPNLLRARKRSASTRVLDELRMLDPNIGQYGIEANKSGSNVPKAIDGQRIGLGADYKPCQAQPPAQTIQPSSTK